MQCACPECGDMMAKIEAGMNSRCVCPNCDVTCAVCLGLETRPLDVEALKSRYDHEEKPDDPESF